MRISMSKPAILFGILVHLLVAGVASSTVEMNYQPMRSGNCRSNDQQMEVQVQNMNCCEPGDDGGGGGGGDGGRGGMGMSRHMNPKQVASNIAMQAAHDAKKASDTQLPAAVAAARQVKLQLADRAGAAAWAAEAALAGKQQIVEQLRAEVREAETVLQDETASMGASQNNLNAAVCTSNQANDLLQRIQDALKIAQETVSTADAAVCGAHQELQEKGKLVEAAQRRLEMLVQQLRNSKIDYDNTRKAAYRASCAAAEARQKAMRERRSSAKEIKAYRDQEQSRYLKREQAKLQDIHENPHQTLVQTPMRKVNYKQMQPEGWEYNHQAQFAAVAKPKHLKKRRLSDKNKKAYREPQYKQQQLQEQAPLQEVEENRQQTQMRSQLQEVGENRQQAQMRAQFQEVEEKRQQNQLKAQFQEVEENHPQQQMRAQFREVEENHPQQQMRSQLQGIEDNRQQNQMQAQLQDRANQKLSEQFEYNEQGKGMYSS